MRKSTFLIYAFISLFLSHKLLIAFFAPPSNELAERVLDMSFPMSAIFSIAVYAIGHVKSKWWVQHLVLTGVWGAWLAGMMVVKMTAIKSVKLFGIGNWSQLSPQKWGQAILEIVKILG